ncbi:MAG: ATP-binding protein [Chitinophagales bacterium]|nr:ATP-binding protein [Chitinophagales bacterium]
MKKEVFKQIIADSIENRYAEVKERELPFTIYHGKANCLIGVRRGGKTSLMQATIASLRRKVKPENTVYINLEDDRLFPLTLSDLNDFIDAYYELYPGKRREKVWFFIDEIQVVAGWEKFIRRVLDTENCYITLSGSSARLLSKEIHTTLRGRSVSTEVPTLSFKEYLNFKGIDVNARSTRNLSYIKHALNEYLFKGGFPELTNMHLAEARRFLQEYRDLIVYRDLVERYNIRELFPMRYLINHLFRNLSTLLSINKLHTDLKSQGIPISKTTLYDYIGYLKDCFAIYTVPMFSRSLKEQQRNPQKIYLVDTGFALTASVESDYTKSYENVVYNHLRRRYGSEIYYWKGKQEVDFYVPEEKLLLNVTFDLSNKTTFDREVNGLIESMKSLKVKKSILVNAQREDHISLEKMEIQILPLWKWLLS